MNEEFSKYVGIDVSKDTLDVAFGQEGEYWQADNAEIGIHRTVDRLKALRPALVVVESTGGLETALVGELSAAGVPFALVQPKRVRDFAKSIGLLAKTDKLDARLLARFGEAVHPALSQLAGEEEQELNALMLRRRQILDILVDEKNHLLSTRLSLRSKVEDHLAWLEAELAELDREIEEHIQNNPHFQEKGQILRTAKGVGPVLCAKLLSGLPELGQMDRKKIAALVGVAPFNDDSGHHRGKRRFKGGRADVREVLYMATVAAVRSNPVIRPFYQHLLQQGKLKKVALGACMRKFLTILNAMSRDAQPFHAYRPIAS